MSLAREPWFNISTGTGWFHHDRSWNDQMNDAAVGHCDLSSWASRACRSTGRPPKVRAESDRITEEYRALIDARGPEAVRRAARLRQTVFPYVENHLFYVEHWFHSVFWNKMREVGAIMQNGIVIRTSRTSGCCAATRSRRRCGTSSPPGPPASRRAARRTCPKGREGARGVMAKFKGMERAAGVGTAPEVIQEPFTIVLWGVTNKSLADWAAVQEVADPDHPELKGCRQPQVSSRARRASAARSARSANCSKARSSSRRRRRRRRRPPSQDRRPSPTSAA